MRGRTNNIDKYNTGTVLYTVHWSGAIWYRDIRMRKSEESRTVVRLIVDGEYFIILLCYEWSRGGVRENQNTVFARRG